MRGNKSAATATTTTTRGRSHNHRMDDAESHDDRHGNGYNTRSGDYGQGGNQIV